MIRSNEEEMFEKRSDCIEGIFFLRWDMTSGSISAAKTVFALAVNAVCAWIPEPVPMSKTVLFFA